MNKSFRTYWSKVRQQCVVVSEAQKAPRKKRGGVVTQVALAVLAATFGTAQAADTSSWTVTGKDEVLTEDMDVSGFAYGRIEGFTGWDTQPDTNKLTIAEGVTMTGGVFRYENDDFWGEERNEGESGKTGLMRYHTFVVNGTLKDGETYHDVATNTDKDQIGTVNWFNRLAVGSTGTVNVQEIRVSEALVNEGNLTVGDLYVKDGASFENKGVINITRNLLTNIINNGTDDIFNTNIIDDKLKYTNRTPDDEVLFRNEGKIIVGGSLVVHISTPDEYIGEIEVGSSFETSAHNFAASKIKSNYIYVADDALLKAKTVSANRINIGSGTIQTEKLENLKEFTFIGDSNSISKLIVTGDDDVYIGRVSGNMGAEGSGVFVNGNFKSDNMDLSVPGVFAKNVVVTNRLVFSTNSTVDIGGNVEIGGDSVSYSTITVSGDFAAHGNNFVNFRNGLTAASVNIDHYVSYEEGDLLTTESDKNSIFGVTENQGTINLAGNGEFGAVTNSGTITLDKDAVMASLNQTAGLTTAKDNLTLTGGSTIKGTLNVTNQLTGGKTVTNLSAIQAGSANFNRFVNGEIDNQSVVFSSGGDITVSGGISDLIGTNENPVPISDYSKAGLVNYGTINLNHDSNLITSSVYNYQGGGIYTGSINATGTVINKANNSFDENTILRATDSIVATSIKNSGLITGGAAIQTLHIDNYGIIDNAKNIKTNESLYNLLPESSSISVVGKLEVNDTLWNFGKVVSGYGEVGIFNATSDSSDVSFTDAEHDTIFYDIDNLGGRLSVAGNLVTGRDKDAYVISSAKKDAEIIVGKNFTTGTIAGNRHLNIDVGETLKATVLYYCNTVKAKNIILGDYETSFNMSVAIDVMSAIDSIKVVGNNYWLHEINNLTASQGLYFENGARGSLDVDKGVVSSDLLSLDRSSVDIGSKLTSFSVKHLTTTGSSVINNARNLSFQTMTIGDGLTYNQTAGTISAEDGSFFQNSTLNISGGTLDRTGSTTRAAGANTLGIGNTVNISGSTAGTFTDQGQVGSDWKAGQTVVSVGLLNSDSTVTVKSGGVLETGNIELTSNTLHFDGGAVSASLVNFFDGVSEKVYKITDGSETAVTTNVLGAADVTDVKDSFKDNIDFTANGGTIVVTDAAVSLKAIASASEKLKATAGENADKVNVVFTGQAAGSSGTLTGFYYNTYTELAAEQGQTSHFKDPGVVFATMAYENRAEDGGVTRDKLVVGTAAAADDTYVLSNSIGFARVDGSDNVTVNGGKTFALVGGAEGTNLLNSAAGTLSVTGADSKFVMGTKGVAGTEGVLGTLNVTESGAMNVAMGKYTVANLNLTSGTGSTDTGTTLLVAKLADDAASGFTNAGTLSITSADTLKAAYENSGNFNVTSNTVLQNNFTNTAGRAVFAGTVEMQKAVTNAKDAVIKTAGFTVSSALTGANGNMINNAGRLESTGTNTVEGSLMVVKTGALIATDVTNITTGRINVLGDSHFSEVNIGVGGSGALGAGDGALIHADTITVGSLGQLRLRDGATVVAKNLKVDGLMSAGSVTWALGSAAVNGWDNKNADRLATLMGDYGTTTAMLYALSSRAAYGFARFNADVVKDGTDHSEVSAPAADAVIVDGDDARYVIDSAKTDGFSMTIDSPSDLTTKGNVFSADARTNFTVALGSITVHNDADGTINDAAYLLEGKTFTIEAGGSVTVENTQDDAGYHPGVLVVRGTLMNAGEMNSAAGAGLIVAGNGSVSVSGKDTGKTLVVTDDGTYRVADGEADYAGLQLRGGTLDVASGWFGYGLAKADAGYTGDKSAVFATSLNTIETGDSRVIVGTVAEGDTVTAGSVYFGADSALVLNTSNLVDKTLFKGNDTGTFTVKAGSELAVSHTTWGKHYILGEGYDLSGVEDGAWQGDAVKNLTGDEMELAVTKTDNGKLILSAGRDTTTDDSTPSDPGNSGNGSTTDPSQPDTSIKALSRDYATPDIIDGLINNDANIGLRDPNSDQADIAFIERVLDKNYVGTTADGQLDVKKATRLWNSVVELSAASGSTAYTLTQAMDAMGMIEDRAAGLDQVNGQGSNLWVKPLGKYAKADKLKADGSMTGGFEATTTGIMGGFDLSNDDFTLGLAASYGKGTLKSRGDWTATDTKVEVAGANAYGAVRQGKAALIGLVGYTNSKGEAKQSFSDKMLNAHSVKGDIKNQVFTAGLRGELAFEVTESVTMTPHLGLRYVKTKTDGYDITMNGKSAFKAGKSEGDLWQVPLGVSVKANFIEDAWHVSPFADVSVVRQFGDTDMKTTVSATSFEASDSFRADVVGKTMGELKLGINAELKNHSFGVSYTGSVGTQGTQNHSLSANYRYRF